MSSLYTRSPKYISPSSLAEFEYDPIRFYFNRMGPLEFKLPSFQQTEPMAVGCVFDSLIKFFLRHHTGDKLADNFLEDTVHPQWLKEPSLALWEGVRAFRAYASSPAVRLLKKEGLRRVEPQVQPLRVSDMRASELGGVPIWGKPDAEAFNDVSVVLDWKVTGSIGGNGKINPGYCRLWYHDGYSWRDRGAHHRSMEGMDTLNERWATQCCMYGWMLGFEPLTPFMGGIDQIVMGPVDDPHAVEVAQIRAPITPRFQQTVMTRLYRVWNAIVNKTLLPRGTTYEDLEILALTA